MENQRQAILRPGGQHVEAAALLPVRRAPLTSHDASVSAAQEGGPQSGRLAVGGVPLSR
jgi:hypothetical protein